MVHWLLNTPTVGSIFTILLCGSVLLAYYGVLRWILTAPGDPESGGETMSGDESR